jgi:hypothetical protein
VAETITVPSQLRRPHRYVEETRRAYANVKPDSDGRMRPHPRAGVARLIVSRDQLRRSLLFLQAIFTEAERRGWEIKADATSYGPDGIAIVANGHSYGLSMHELHERVPMTEADIETWRKENAWKLRWDADLKPPTLKSVPNGRLKLSLPSAWDGGRSSWSEGPRGPLDAKLPAFFVEITRRIEEDDRRAEERARQQELQRLQELERLEQERLQRADRARAARLTEEIQAWQGAGHIRDYAAALREHANALNQVDHDRLVAWCVWAENWADQIDPTLHLERIGEIDAT